MEERTFRLRVITPMFLSGANQRTAELRAPSVRGALRFWFRAMMGGVVGGDWKKVQELESEVWGSTSLASRVKVISRGQCTPGKTSDLKTKVGNAGARYLLYSPLLPPKGQPAGEQRPEHVPPGATFDVVLGARADEYLDLSVACLWLLVWLGALGTRCRRGAGALSFCAGQSPETYQWKHEWKRAPGPVALTCPASTQDLCRYLSDGVHAIRSVFQEFAGVSSPLRVSGAPAFDVIAPDCFVLYVVSCGKTSWDDWSRALDGYGASYRDWRRTKPKSDRRYLGLPLTGYDTQSRRGSPLWVRPVQLRNGGWCVVTYAFLAAHSEKDPTRPDIVIRLFEHMQSVFSVMPVGVWS